MIGERAAPIHAEAEVHGIGSRTPFGELALALGLRHPEIYGAIFSASPGAGYRPPDAMPSRLPRTYLVAGTLEPFFLDNAARWATALRDATADVVMSERAAGLFPTPSFVRSLTDLLVAAGEQEDSGQVRAAQWGIFRGTERVQKRRILGRCGPKTVSFSHTGFGSS